MNIFFLDRSPALSAQLLCDKHVLKMTIESAQMLSTIQRYFGNSDLSLYKSTHLNHPCTLWARKTSGNYAWLLQHLIALLEEYSHRFRRQHKTSFTLPSLSLCPDKIPNDTLIFDTKVTDNDLSDVIESYRLYYFNKSSRMPMKWSHRCPPEFISSEYLVTRPRLK